MGPVGGPRPRAPLTCAGGCIGVSRYGVDMLCCRATWGHLPSWEDVVKASATPAPATVGAAEPNAMDTDGSSNEPAAAAAAPAPIPAGAAAAGIVPFTLHDAFGYELEPGQDGLIDIEPQQLYQLRTPDAIFNEFLAPQMRVFEVRGRHVAKKGPRLRVDLRPTDSVRTTGCVALLFQEQFVREKDVMERDATVVSCLSVFQREEQLGADDTWYGAHPPPPRTCVLGQVRSRS